MGKFITAFLISTLLSFGCSCTASKKTDEAEDSQDSASNSTNTDNTQTQTTGAAPTLAQTMGTKLRGSSGTTRIAYTATDSDNDLSTVTLSIESGGSCLSTDLSAFDATCPNPIAATNNTDWSLSINDSVLSHNQVLNITAIASDNGGNQVEAESSHTWKLAEGTLVSNFSYDIAVNKPDSGFDVLPDSTGNYFYIVGAGQDLVAGSSNWDIFVKKYDYAGTEFTDGNWATPRLLDRGNNFNAPHDQVLYEGVIYAVGSGSGGSSDFLLMSVNEDGTLGWQIAADSATESHYHGVDAYDGHVYICGDGVNVVSGSSSRDLVIHKYTTAGVEDTSGNWPIEYNLSDLNDRCRDIVVDSSGIYIFGKHNNGGNVSFVRRYNLDGTVDWTTEIGYTAFEFFHEMNIKKVNDTLFVGGYTNNIVTGTSDADWYFQAFTTTGVNLPAFSQEFDNGDNSDQLYDIAHEPSTDSFFLAGNATNAVTGSSGSDWWIKRMLNDGSIDPNWNIFVDVGDALDELIGVAITPTGDVMVTGNSINVVSGTSGQDTVVRIYSGP